MSTAVGLSGLIPGTRELIAELVERLSAGETFDNRKLTIAADRVFGGSRAKGAYSPRDAYDAMETAVNQLLLQERAEALLQMLVAEAFALLRSLTAQLPRQNDRTTEQTQWQQFSTPPALAFLAAKLLAPQPSDIALEPSSRAITPIRRRAAAFRPSLSGGQRANEPITSPNCANWG